MLLVAMVISQDLSFLVTFFVPCFPLFILASTHRNIQEYISVFLSSRIHGIFPYLWLIVLTGPQGCMSLILTVIIFYSPRISLTLSLFFWALLACIQISYAISLYTLCNVRVSSLHSLVEYQGNCRKRVTTLLPLVTRDPYLYSFKFEQGSWKLLSLQSASFQISQQATRSFESVRFEHGLLSLL